MTASRTDMSPSESALRAALADLLLVIVDHKAQLPFDDHDWVTVSEARAALDLPVGMS